MPHLPMKRRLQLRVGYCSNHLLRVMVVVMRQSSHLHERQEMVRIGATRMQKMWRNRRAGKQMVGGRISRRGSQSSGTISRATTTATSRYALHSLEIKAVLLQMASNILSSEAINTHELHYSLGHSILDPQVRHSIHKPLVELWRPHEPGPLESPSRFLPCGPRTQVSRISSEFS